MALEHNPSAGALEGERYPALVPDTLDLADRMKLAVNALTNVFDEREKNALYFVVTLAHKPPRLIFNNRMDAYLNIPPKFLETLTLCRLGSGSGQNLDVDRAVWQSQLDLIGPDGLSYIPTDTLTIA